MLKPVITAACLCASSAVAAQAGKLQGRELSEMVAGATVEIDAPMGYKLPVSYTADGHMTGQAGGLASYLGSATDTGRWWVKADQLCHRWKHWFTSETKCMRIELNGRAIQWSDLEGNSGTGTIIARAPVETAQVMPEATVSQPAPKARPADIERPLPSPPVSAEIAPEAPVLIPPAPTRVARADVLPRPAGAGLESVPIARPQVRPPAAGSALQPAAEISRATDIAPTPLFTVANVAQDDVLNVRSGPSAEHEVVGGLPPGSRVAVNLGSCQSDWCPVQHQAASGWVNRTFLSDARDHERAGDEARIMAFPPQRVGMRPEIPASSLPSPDVRQRAVTSHSPSDAPRSCLTAAARQLLQQIEEKFGAMKLVSTCRPGATIAGTGRPSRHASGNAVDFNAGSRKSQVVAWLIANHRGGGTMTYADMDHIHFDIGPHFVSIAGGQQWASWRNTAPRGRASADKDADTDD